MIKTLTRRWAAIFVLAGLAFAQASIALAACSMDRGMLAAAMAMPAGEECDACEMPRQQAAMASANACIAHCTADLQQASQAVAIVPGPAAVLVHFVMQPPGPPASSKGLTAAPPGAPPHRVLLHSFLI